MNLKFWNGWFTKAKQTPPATNKANVGEVFTLPWIEDENLLKDEAVLTAAAGSNPECKLNTIREYFAGKVMVAEENLKSLQQQLEQSREQETKQSDILEAISQKLLALNQLPHSVLQAIFRHFFGLLLYGAMVTGYTFLIYEKLKPHYEFAIFISFSITALGFFALYHSRSVLFKSNKAIKVESEQEGGPELWKVLLEEISVPLAVALFIAFHEWNTQPIWLTVGSGLISFIVFLIAGKSLLSTLTKLRDEFAIAAQNRRLRRQQKLEMKEQQNKQQEVQKTLCQLRQQLEELTREHSETSRQRSELISKGNALASLFQGEYELAIDALKTLTHHQISSITEAGILTQN